MTPRRLLRVPPPDGLAQQRVPRSRRRRRSTCRRPCARPRGSTSAAEARRAVTAALGRDLDPPRAARRGRGQRSSASPRARAARRSGWRWTRRLAYALRGAHGRGQPADGVGAAARTTSASATSRRSARARCPTGSTIVSLWSSLEGSILFWGLVLGVYIAAATCAEPRPAPRVHAVRDRASGSPAARSSASCSPGRRIRSGRCRCRSADGPGPNPLLQNHVLMIIHPPFLYLGYVGHDDPVRHRVARRCSRGRLGHDFLRPLRTWLLLPWIFLTVAIMLGGWWAYEVLGWGGYWAWDPVENASFLPWLTATAALHSALVIERKGIAQGLDRHAGAGDLPAHDPRHVHDALGRLQLGALVHAERHRPDDPRLPGASRSSGRSRCSRCASTGSRADGTHRDGAQRARRCSSSTTCCSCCSRSRC